MSAREESRETTPRCLVLSVLILILNLNLDPGLFPSASPVLFLFVQDSSGAEGATDVLAPGKRGWLFSSPVFLPLATIPRAHSEPPAKNWLCFRPAVRAILI